MSGWKKKWNKESCLIKSDRCCWESCYCLEGWNQKKHLLQTTPNTVPKFLDVPHCQSSDQPDFPGMQDAIPIDRLGWGMGDDCWFMHFANLWMINNFFLKHSPGCYKCSLGFQGSKVFGSMVTCMEVPIPRTSTLPSCWYLSWFIFRIILKRTSCLVFCADEDTFCLMISEC